MHVFNAVLKPQHLLPLQQYLRVQAAWRFLIQLFGIV